ncbi:hypothetical protein B0H13DRAFT_1643265 [Mycena leptocephala]|nr:hypothetical protein B0H13DRAFT_1650751 [Mycena leptocephala]KAJ7852861.1 hypothetical protein B0H13DRAFT_1643265 [Mycena leptocephala]
MENGVPKWAADARDLLRDGPGGAVWDGVLEEWWKHEEAAAFTGPPKGQQPKSRPKQVQGWIARARTGGPNPALIDVFAFASQWWTWWKALNPEWRRDGAVNGERLARSGEGEWGPIVQTGPNGFLNVLICLRWWRDVINAGEMGAWEEALNDIKWVLERNV